MSIMDKLEAEAKALADKAKDAFAHKDELIAKAEHSLAEGAAKVKEEVKVIKDKAAHLVEEGEEAIKSKFKT